MKHSEQLDKLLPALHNARMQFKELEKSGSNNFFKNKKGEPHKFSTLDDIFSACKDALFEHGIEVIYTTSLADDKNILQTSLFHIESGQWMRSETAIGDVNSEPQKIGSGITYMRRYHIQAMLNLEADFEDDGNVASGNTSGDGNVISKKVKIRKSSNEVDYDYSGPPYRIFDASNSLARQFTDLRTWTTGIRAELKKVSDSALVLKPNAEEAKRIRKEIEDIQNITDRAKQEKISFIDELFGGSINDG